VVELRVEKVIDPFDEESPVVDHSHCIDLAGCRVRNSLLVSSYRDAARTTRRTARRFGTAAATRAQRAACRFSATPGHGATAITWPICHDLIGLD
jgi:hypothetical protein